LIINYLFVFTFDIMKNFINRFFLTLVFVFSLLTNANSQMLIYGRISGTQVVKLEIQEEANNSVTITRTTIQDTSFSDNQCNKDTYTYYTYALGQLIQNINGNKISITIPNDGYNYWVIDFSNPNLTSQISSGTLERTCCCSNGTNDCKVQNGGGKTWCEGCECHQCDWCPDPGPPVKASLVYLKAAYINWN
jgi:hypothetical protein